MEDETVYVLLRPEDHCVLGVFTKEHMALRAQKAAGLDTEIQEEILDDEWYLEETTE